MEDTLNCIHPEGKVLMESEDWADVGVIMSVPTLNVPISWKITRPTNISLLQWEKINFVTLATPYASEYPAQH